MKSLLTEATQNEIRRAIDENVDGVASIDVTALAWLFGVCQGLESRVRSQQAHIDELMLEYCPDEMTPAQIAEWKEAQQPFKETANEQ
jgi:hypothetical protein